MNSHEYAKKLGELADVLMRSPEFDTPWNEALSYETFTYYDKDKFLAAVRAIGAGIKDWQKDELVFHPARSGMLKLRINRNKVCRKVQEERWECEPLLSQDEEAAIGA